MISLNNIMIMRGSQVLLRDVSLVLHKGQRTGVIGRNGCGKTSLFRVLDGELAVEEGELFIPAGLRIASMAQETPGSSRSALEFVLDAHLEFRRLEKEMLRAEESGDDNKLAHLHSEFEAIDAYDISHRAETLLSGLGFSTTEFSNPISSFSGGWRVRLNLAAALMCPSDLLLLDEPSNHLDLEATVWLEQWLQQYLGTLLLISHDRTFLDSVIDNVISFEGNGLDFYKGNYSAYEKQRAERLALQQAMFEKQQRRRAEIEDFVRRFRVKASKAKQAQSRLKELGRMQDIAPAHIDSPFKFQFPDPGVLPAYLMQLEKLAIGFDAPLVENITLSIRSESRIGLLGFNGSGKSTLLKVLSGQMEPMAGELNPSKKLRLGYFAQHQVDELDAHATPLQLLQKVDGKCSEQEIRNFLGGFDFRGTRVDEKIGIFSGGEKARLALAKIAWQKPNLLLLDEPTNHLDLEMVHALTVALQEFAGAMIIVSHDRHLLMNTVDEFYSIHQGVFAEFSGNLSDYEKWLGEQAKLKDLTASVVSNDKEAEKLDKKEKRQQAAVRRERLAPLRLKERELDRQMEKIHKRLQQLEESLADETLYEEAKKKQLNECLLEQGKQRSELAACEELWLQIQEEIADFE